MPPVAPGYAYTKRPGSGFGGLSLPKPRIGNDGELLEPDGDLHVPEQHVPLYRVGQERELSLALAKMGLVDRPVITLIGGAGAAGAQSRESRRFYESLVLAAAAAGGVLLYGGTDSGCLAELGLAKRRLLASGAISEFAPLLIGVTAIDTIALPGQEYDPNFKAPLQPDQDFLIVVPGPNFGDESWPIALVGQLISREHGSATVLVNGGGITLLDAQHRLMAVQDSDDPLLVIRGTGRSADDIAAAKDSAGPGGQGVADLIAADPRTIIVDNLSQLPIILERALTTRTRKPLPKVPHMRTPIVPRVVHRLSPAAAYDLGLLYMRDMWESVRLGQFQQMVSVDPASSQAWEAAPKADRDRALSEKYRANENLRTDQTVGDSRSAIRAFAAAVEHRLREMQDNYQDEPGLVDNLDQAPPLRRVIPQAAAGHHVTRPNTPKPVRPV